VARVTCFGGLVMLMDSAGAPRVEIRLHVERSRV
jgi:hypothetical protein